MRIIESGLTMRAGHGYSIELSHEPLRIEDHVDIAGPIFVEVRQNGLGDRCLHDGSRAQVITRNGVGNFR